MKLVKNLFTIIKLNHYMRKINNIKYRLYGNIISMCELIDSLENYIHTSKIPYCSNYDITKTLLEYVPTYDKLFSKIQSDIYHLKKIVNKTISDVEHYQLANSCIHKIESIVNKHNSRYLEDIKRANLKSAEILYQTDIIKDNIRTYTNQFVADIDKQILGDQKK